MQPIFSGFSAIHRQPVRSNPGLRFSGDNGSNGHGDTDGSEVPVDLLDTVPAGPATSNGNGTHGNGNGHAPIPADGSVPGSPTDTVASRRSLFDIVPAPAPDGSSISPRKKAAPPPADVRRRGPSLLSTITATAGVTVLATLAGVFGYGKLTASPQEGLPGITATNSSDKLKEALASLAVKGDALTGYCTAPDKPDCMVELKFDAKFYEQLLTSLEAYDYEVTEMTPEQVNETLKRYEIQQQSAEAKNDGGNLYQWTNHPWGKAKPALILIPLGAGLWLAIRFLRQKAVDHDEERDIAQITRRVIAGLDLAEDRRIKDNDLRKQIVGAFTDGGPVPEPTADE